MPLAPAGMNPKRLPHRICTNSCPVLRATEIPVKPEVSVIIVSWNCQQLLSECLQSLLCQLSAASSEIIVVDNASTDGTPHAIRTKFPAVQLIETGGNLGFARGNNI